VSDGGVSGSVPRPIASDSAALGALLVPARSSLHRGGKPPQYSPCMPCRPLPGEPFSGALFPGRYASRGPLGGRLL